MLVHILKLKNILMFILMKLINLEKKLWRTEVEFFLIDDFGKWKNGDINLFDNFLREKMIDDLLDLDNVKFFMGWS